MSPSRKKRKKKPKKKEKDNEIVQVIFISQIKPTYSPPLIKHEKKIIVAGSKKIAIFAATF